MRAYKWLRLTALRLTPALNTSLLRIRHRTANVEHFLLVCQTFSSFYSLPLLSYLRKTSFVCVLRFGFCPTLFLFPFNSYKHLRQKRWKRWKSAQKGLNSGLRPIPPSIWPKIMWFKFQYCISCPMSCNRFALHWFAMVFVLFIRCLFATDCNQGSH